MEINNEIIMNSIEEEEIADYRPRHRIIENIGLILSVIATAYLVYALYWLYTNPQFQDTMSLRILLPGAIVGLISTIYTGGVAITGIAFGWLFWQGLRIAGYSFVLMFADDDFMLGFILLGLCLTAGLFVIVLACIVLALMLALPIVPTLIGRFSWIYGERKVR